jgi:hypothetical protein
MNEKDEVQLIVYVGQDLNETKNANVQWGAICVVTD